MFHAALAYNDKEVEKLQEAREAELEFVGSRNGSHSSNERKAKHSTLGENLLPPSFLILLVEAVLCYDLFAVSPNTDEDEFEKWKREVEEAEAEAERLKNGSLSGNTGDDLGIDDPDRVLSPPDGEDEFTDDDGTTYKWDGSLRAWVPQVGCHFVAFGGFIFILIFFQELLKLYCEILR